jgi:hypothetical protein
MTKARVIYLLVVAAMLAYYLAALKSAGMSDGGPVSL